MSRQLSIWHHYQTHTKRASTARVSALGFPGADAVARESTTFCSTFHLNGLMHQTRVLFSSSLLNIFSLLIHICTSVGVLSLLNLTAFFHKTVSTKREHFVAVLDLSGRAAILKGRYPMAQILFVSTATTKYLI